MTSLATVAAALYALPPGEFTSARNASAAAHRELAADIKALKRPTVAAWALNALARSDPSVIAELVELGEALREAQAVLSGSELKELGRQRRLLVSSAITRTREVALVHGQRLSDAVLRQVEETLVAAMADRSVGEAVASGLLTTSLSSTGLEAAAEALAIPLSSGVRPALELVHNERSQLAAARARLRHAERELETVDARGGSLQRDLARARVEVRDLREKLSAAESREASLAESAAGIADDLEVAEAAVVAAREAVESFQSPT